ncbi:MAG TPA: hypothetical protein VN258_10835 [Mobilitalea sp.]|nr:hypothetical protein [Mobilitalea sp.]
MRYKNFNASVYCPVGNLVSIKDFDEFDRKFKLLENNVKVGKVYLETYRGGTLISREQMLKVIEFFAKKGIEVAGGITTDDVYDPEEGGFSPQCYTSETVKDRMKKVVTLTAALFDEFILDDFYFTNCRCDSCIEAKGNRTWSEFRLALMKDFSENVIMKTAREINPNVKAIIKFPNWYEHFQDSGYNLEDEPKIFDYIYTGTETRNPTYTQQHLPKYLSYFIMRYHEHVAPERNLGGWFDPYECTYNLTSYLEQGYLTLFAKAKEAMLFSLGSLINDKAFTAFPPVIGQAFEDVDRYFAELGNPIGVPCYVPYHSYGEDYLHNYVGMCAVPMEPYPDYPTGASTLFLTESAAQDPELVSKMKNSLKAGADIVVTSGLVTRLGDAFQELTHVSYTDKKALVNSYMCSADGGVTMAGNLEAAKSILLTQPQFFTNDVWQIAGGYGEDNNTPIILKTKYSKGRLFILTIPDDQGNLYHYPNLILNTLRAILSKDLPVVLEGDSKITLFLYDNSTFILRSFLPYFSKVSVIVKKENIVLTDLENGKELQGEVVEGGTRFTINLSPGVNYVMKY